VGMKRYIISAVAVSLAALAASGIANADQAATTTQPPAVSTQTQNSEQPAMPDASNTTAQQQPTQTQPDATATQGSTTTTTAEQPAVKTQPDTTTTTAEQPAVKTQPDATTTTAEQPAVKTQPDTTTTSAEQPAQPAGKVIAINDLDPASSTMASNFIGSSVYTAANENVGDVNDLILGSDGSVKAVILGVGGFLGMGEKDVAVPLSQLNFTKDENGSVKIMINASRADLDATPAFDRKTFKVGTIQQ